MKMNVNEISSVLEKEIKNFQSKMELTETGEIIAVGDGIARVYGLDKVMFNEMVEFEDGTLGLAFNLEENSVGIIILGSFAQLREGHKVRRLGKVLEISVGHHLLGKIVDAMGRPLLLATDEEKTANASSPAKAATRKIEFPAPGIAMREPVHEPMETGIKAIDSMIPIGRGQRQLIIGDRSTGKTSIAIDTIINQKGKGVICVYVAIGQKTSKIAAIHEKLGELGALDYTVIVLAAASDPASMQYLAPYTGTAIAEHFMYSEKQATLCVYDDLSKHANAYRQISLLLRRPPGREAYPGDVFYLHSRLLERAAKLSADLGGGSLTALPLVETQEGEVSAYIPTNVISITDGQIYLQPALFASGQRPAIDVGISVSRVGGAAQTKAMKSVAGKIKLELAQFRELEAFSQLGSDLDAGTKAQLDRGNRLLQILRQPESAPYTLAQQVLSIFSVIKGLLDRVPITSVQECDQYLSEQFQLRHADIVKEINEKKVIATATGYEDELLQRMQAIVDEWLAKNVKTDSV